MSDLALRALLGIFRLLHHLPLSLLAPMGRGLGRILFLLSRERRHVVRTNLALCFPQWTEAERIVSIDPWGAKIGEAFGPLIEAGIDIRPSIAVTKAHIDMPEIRTAIADDQAGRLA